MELIEKRVRDGSLLRRIRKWINVGVMDNARLRVTETGTGQGRLSALYWPMRTGMMCLTSGLNRK